MSTYFAFPDRSISNLPLDDTAILINQTTIDTVHSNDMSAAFGDTHKRRASIGRTIEPPIKSASYALEQCDTWLHLNRQQCFELAQYFDCHPVRFAQWLFVSKLNILLTFKHQVCVASQLL